MFQVGVGENDVGYWPDGRHLGVEILLARTV